MVEILPNWHPLFVHFTVALLTISVVFFILAWLIPTRFPLADEFLIVARWSLWCGMGITLATIITGFWAFNTVTHDAVLHIAMVEHRNWAVLTFVTIIVMGLWSLLRYYENKRPNSLFIIGLLVMLGLLATTAWHGAELVFRHGLGVMSLPSPEKTQQPHYHH